MSTVSPTPDIRGQWANRLIRETLAKEYNVLARQGKLGELPVGSAPYSHHNLPSPPPLRHVPPVGRGKEQLPTQHKICIVGAGISGLYIAMILEDLKIPDLKYEILEAGDRIGGRVYTHHFSEKKHDYYDIGAMRFPKIPIMERTFDLFKRMEGDKFDENSIIPYYLDGQNCPKLFNNRFYELGDDPYQVGEAHGGCVPDFLVKENAVSDALEATYDPYKKALKTNFDAGFEKLMRADLFTTREFLRRGGLEDDYLVKYRFHAINWMETMDTSTSLFTQSFTESVLDSFDFDYDAEVSWYCIDGGTSLLTNAMADKINRSGRGTIKLGKRVEAVSIKGNNKDDRNMSVTYVEGEKRQETSDFSTVFSTTSLGCLQRMDLRGINPHPTLRDAIRSLHYDDSVKVAIKFSRPWWITDCSITQGGLAKTDLPLRTCVYPSYNLNDGANESAVLLCSYTWSQDARRVGSLIDKSDPKEGKAFINGPKPTHENELVDLILKNLARLHENAILIPEQKITYEKLKGLYLDHHAYSWSQDPTTSGAFALFGPGQFSNFYPYLVRPSADCKFHIVGEASSHHHAWIVGALDSAYDAVHKFLTRFDLVKYRDDLETRWGLGRKVTDEDRKVEMLQIFLGQQSRKDQVQVV
ncbi:hypothetical protein M426DRAFT_68361 [Hypoxylon sp. CI-4A]|nr:hypothetical protein M426DRAFT_68361 [Hypoxylon sp. CI-4A]